MLSASSLSVTSPATLEESAPVFCGSWQMQTPREFLSSRSQREDKKQDSDMDNEGYYLLWFIVP